MPAIADSRYTKEYGWEAFMGVAATISDDALLDFARECAEGVSLLYNIPPDIEKYLRTGDESLKRDWLNRTPAYIAYWCAYSDAEQWGALAHAAVSYKGSRQEHFNARWIYRYNLLKEFKTMPAVKMIIIHNCAACPYTEGDLRWEDAIYCDHWKRVEPLKIEKLTESGRSEGVLPDCPLMDYTATEIDAKVTNYASSS